jgi:hypothetical protein
VRANKYDELVVVPMLLANSTHTEEVHELVADAAELDGGYAGCREGRRHGFCKFVRKGRARDRFAVVADWGGISGGEDQAEGHERQGSDLHGWGLPFPGRRAPSDDAEISCWLPNGTCAGSMLSLSESSATQIRTRITTSRINQRISSRGSHATGRVEDSCKGNSTCALGTWSRIFLSQETRGA